MRKPGIRAGVVATLVAALGLASASCGGEAGALAAEPLAGVTPTAVVAVADRADGTGTLTADEAEALYWMREEEKLARDVYLVMADLWGAATFENIATSEARHMEAVLRLIEAYGLDDPVADDTPGVFTNADLASLYAELVEQGSASLVDALTVGALIEDLDIRDLEERLVITAQTDIERVFSSLLRGSVNHLRAFTTRLSAEGAEYQAVYHTDDELAALLADSARPGREPRRRGGR